MKVTDKSKKVYTPFPPPQEKSKVDLQIESGEYFLGKQAKERAARERKEEGQRERRVERKRERERDFVPPKEEAVRKEKKRKRKEKEEGKEGKEKKKKKNRASEIVED